MKRALIVVDVQKDFCPGGALPSPAGHDIIPHINRAMEKFDYVLASKDWHPHDTVHFGRWPVHCVKETPGASFHDQLQVDMIDEVLLKGTRNVDDGYSAFEATSHDVTSLLNQKGIRAVYVCGLTTEYCVKATALDAIKNGFEAFVIADATGPVAANPGDEQQAYEDMKQRGVHIVRLQEIA